MPASASIAIVGVDVGERQRVGERDQLVGALGRLDRGDPRDGDDVALRVVAGGHARGGRRRHPHDRAGARAALGRRPWRRRPPSGRVPAASRWVSAASIDLHGSESPATHRSADAGLRPPLRRPARARRRRPLDVELPDGATVGDLLAALAARRSAAAPRGSSWRSTASTRGATRRSRAGDEIALIPPVSGGAEPVRHVRVTGEPLDVAALAAAVRDPRAGAVVLFEGVTREVARARLRGLRRDGRARLEAIAAEEAERHGLCAVAVEHRTGTVPLSEPSVIVAASRRTAARRSPAPAPSSTASRPRRRSGRSR